MYGGVAVALLAATPASWCGLPAHLGIEPDRQRSAALERFIVGWPVPGLVGWRCGSAHGFQLPRWIHEMNPKRDLCNRAPESARTARFREARRRPEGKAFDLANLLGDYDVKKQVTRGRSGRISVEIYYTYYTGLNEHR